MKDSWSYIKDTGDFLKKIKRLIPEGAMLITAYHNKPRDLGSQSLRKRLNETDICKSTN